MVEKDSLADIKENDIQLIDIDTDFLGIFEQPEKISMNDREFKYLFDGFDDFERNSFDSY